MSVEQVVTELVKTADLFGVVLSETRIETYLEAVDDLEAEDVADALRAARRTAKFFPRPVEIRELVEGSPVDRAEELWMHVRAVDSWRELREHRDVGPGSELAAIREAVESVGGWPMLHGEANVRQVPALHRDFVTTLARILAINRRDAIQTAVRKALLPMPPRELPS